MSKGQVYNYNEVMKRATDFNAQVHEFGPEQIGEHIIMSKDPQGMVATYLMTSWNNQGAYYECVYTDY